MELGLKWVHMACYELILRLDGDLWLTIISKTPLTPRRAIKIQNQQKVFFSPGEDTTKLRWFSGRIKNRLQLKALVQDLDEDLDLVQDQENHAVWLGSYYGWRWSHTKTGESLCIRIILNPS